MLAVADDLDCCQFCGGLRHEVHHRRGLSRGFGAVIDPAVAAPILPSFFKNKSAGFHRDAAEFAEITHA
jgi:hypothetical protein